MFAYSAQIFLHHTDAAGRLFFANQFYLMHEAMEKFMESLGLPIEKFLNGNPDLSFPLVHAEADYKALLAAGDRISIEVSIDKIGETSVHFIYAIRKTDGTLAGSGKTVNVSVNKTTGQKTKLPQDWLEKLKNA